MIRNSALIFALTLCVAGNASADTQIRIVDAKGVTRAMSEIQDKARVEISLNDSQGKPATTREASIRLLNKKTPSNSVQVSANSGLAIFNNVEPGTWALVTLAPGLTITNISMASMNQLSDSDRASMGAVLQGKGTSSATLAVAPGVAPTVGAASATGGAAGVASGAAAAAAAGSIGVAGSAIGAIGVAASVAGAAAGAVSTSSSNETPLSPAT